MHLIEFSATLKPKQQKLQNDDNNNGTKHQSTTSSKLHIAMFPWFAVDHIIPYHHLSNELADTERGHKISFLLPTKAKLLLQPLNLRSHNLITFYPISVPHVDGLPIGTETASDVHISLTSLLGVAFDLTRPQVEDIVRVVEPGFVFYDFAHWVPEIAARLGIKSVSYNVVSVPALCNIAALGKGRELGLLPGPDPGISDGSWLCHYPTPTVVSLRRNKVGGILNTLTCEFGRGVTLLECDGSSMKLADAIALRTCKELEGQFCDYLIAQFEKPVLLTGSALPDDESSTTELGEPWASWLEGHQLHSVVYCKLGSQTILEKEQFQEILLGFEFIGYPFIVALKPPTGCSTLEEAFPEGFEERVRGRGMVIGGWVPHSELLKHSTVGCYVSHCGYEAMWESLMGSPEIVLMPEMWDQILSTRMLAGEMKVAVEVEKDERGFTSRDKLYKAIKEAMDKEAMTKKNHAKWGDMLKGQGFMSGYIDNFVVHLQSL